MTIDGGKAAGCWRVKAPQRELPRASGARAPGRLCPCKLRDVTKARPVACNDELRA